MNHSSRKSIFQQQCHLKTAERYGLAAVRRLNWHMDESGIRLARKAASAALQVLGRHPINGHPDSTRTISAKIKAKQIRSALLMKRG